jgi:hypothetical protein
VLVCDKLAGFSGCVEKTAGKAARIATTLATLAQKSPARLIGQPAGLDFECCESLSR